MYGIRALLALGTASSRSLKTPRQFSKKGVPKVQERFWGNSYRKMAFKGETPKRSVISNGF